MEDCISKICPYCSAEIKEGEDVKLCPACGIPHHVGCWEENNGCSTSGCPEQHRAEQEAVPTVICSKCGAPLQDSHVFCPSCGQKVEAAPDENAAATTDQPDENAAATTDQPDENAAAMTDQPVQNEVVKKKSNKLWLIILAIVLTVSTVGVISGVCIANAQKNKMHDRLMSANWWSYDDDTKLYLDFSEDEIVYSGYFGSYLGKIEIATINYDVVDKDTIRVHGVEIEVDLDEDSVVFYPSFVNTESFSLWLD